MPRWLLYALLTMLLWGGWGFASRKLGDALSAEQTLVISSLGLLPILIILGLRKEPARPTAGRGTLFAGLGGLIGGAGNLAYYRLLSAGEKAATIVPLTSLYPLVTVVLAMLFLRERLNRIQIAGVLLALAAIYFFNVARAAGLFNVWLAFALVPVGLWGVAGLLQKIATNHLSAERSTLWFLLGYLPISVVVWLTQPMKSGSPVSVWAWAIALGLLLGLGNLTVLAAYASHGLASVITPLTGLYPLVTVPLAIVFLGERVTAREGAGIALSLLAVAALSWEEARRPAADRVVAFSPQRGSRGER